MKEMKSEIVASKTQFKEDDKGFFYKQNTDSESEVNRNPDIKKTVKDPMSQFQNFDGADDIGLLMSSVGLGGAPTNPSIPPFNMEAAVTGDDYKERKHSNYTPSQSQSQSHSQNSFLRE